MITGRPDDPTLRRILAETRTLQRRPKTLWLQEGLWHDQVGRDAEAAGMQVVMDRPPHAGGAPSLMVEHARLR